ncbi:MAG TPA: sigma-70 family RNA polymerase sigma factor [Polyangiaceae bacterium]|nr:sigma-70 family RNA polymerase sigma factor [Polyangiaceae bacterium]
MNATLPHVNGHPRYDRDAEALLIARARAGDARAANQLVAAHLRDVAFIAHKYRNYGTPLDELVAEGSLGLLRALEKFDPERGTRFGTYAAYWIRAYVVTYVLRSRSLVTNRTGVLRTRLFFKLRRERARLETMHGASAETNRLLAERLTVTEAQLERMIARADARDVSLDAPVSEDAGATLGDSLSGGADPETAYAATEMQRRVEGAVADAFAALDPRERFIAEARFLATGEDELSLAEIGRRLGVSRERARQLESRARKKLELALSERHGLSREWISPAA